LAEDGFLLGPGLRLKFRERFGPLGQFPVTADQRKLGLYLSLGTGALSLLPELFGLALEFLSTLGSEQDRDGGPDARPKESSTRQFHESSASHTSLTCG
jgi:hypothetical protein